MNFLLLAGESSGDLHGANLIKNLRKFYPESTFYCFGGDKMAEAGARLLLHYREMAFMGFYEVVKNLPKILKNLNYCKNWITENRPDAIIYIDFPGFNMRIAKFAKAKGYLNIYYISPQIWAWKERRVYQIKRDIDLMITILPFEKNFYEKYDYAVEYVGHPLYDALEEYLNPSPTQNNRLYDIAFLPGSRLQEVHNILPVMAETARRNPEYSFVVAGAPSVDKNIYASHISAITNIELHFGKTYELLSCSKAAIVTSGTATLETALLGVPLAVVYKGSPVSYWIAKQLVKVKYISLVNLILGKEAVPELIQSECSVYKVEDWVRKLLEDQKVIEAQKAEFMKLREILGGKGASKRAATAIYNYIERNKNA
ncbi:MAG: lipid-A-disaccharide synthase [Thermaurantimonas sp.]